MRIGEAKSIVADMNGGFYTKHEILSAIFKVYGEEKQSLTKECAENAVHFLIGKIIELSEVERSNENAE